jgi:uncharacterized C2H2 Zn-finger protein
MQCPPLASVLATTMDDTARACGKCGAIFKTKRGVAKHVLKERCGNGPGVRSARKKSRKSFRCAVNGVQNEAIPVSRFSVSGVYKGNNDLSVVANVHDM